MASDGCQSLFAPAPAATVALAPASKTAGGATGVWYGPAPTGWRTATGAPVVAVELPFDAAKEPRSLPLPGGLRLPMLGVTATDDASVRCASAPAPAPALTDAGPPPPQGGARSRLLARRTRRRGGRGPGAAWRCVREGVPGGGAAWRAARRRCACLGGAVPALPAHLARPHAAAVQASCASLLTTLGVSSLDLLLLDVAAAAAGAPEPLPQAVAAAWAGVEALLASSTVRAVGVAHCGWATLEALLGCCAVKPVVNLCELHPLLSQVRRRGQSEHRRCALTPTAFAPQRKLCGCARRKGVAMAALAPLARGDPALMEHPTVLKLAAAYGKTPAQLLVRYNLQRGVPVLSKSGLSLEELEGAFSFRISYPDKVHLDELDAGRRFLQPPQGCSFPTVD